MTEFICSWVFKNGEADCGNEATNFVWSNWRAVGRRHYCDLHFMKDSYTDNEIISKEDFIRRKRTEMLE